MRNLMIGAVAFVLLAGCVRTAVTPIAGNQFLLTTAAAPVCGSTGAANVISQMAAVETIRRGYDRYVILGADAANNVRVTQTGPTYAQTTGTAYVNGNTAYGSSTTSYGGNQTIVSGSHDAALRVLMLRPTDVDYANGLDARSILGPDWQKKVQNGIKTC